MDDATLFDLFGSVSHEIGGVSREVGGLREDMRAGFDRLEARVGRQGGIINGGPRQIARLVEWSEKIDSLIADRDREIADLKQRVEKLEGR